MIAASGRNLLSDLIHTGEIDGRLVPLAYDARLPTLGGGEEGCHRTAPRGPLTRHMEPETAFVVRRRLVPIPARLSVLDLLRGSHTAFPVGVESHRVPRFYLAPGRRTTRRLRSSDLIL